MYKSFLVLLFAIVTACSSSTQNAAAKEAPAEQQVLRMNIVTDMENLDPRTARSLTSINVFNMLYEGVTRLSPEGRVELALASSVDISADLRTYTITLRPAEWSDGTPLTAHDLAYAWRSALAPDFPAPSANQMYIISQAEEYKKGEATLEELGVKVLDGMRLQVTLKHSCPYFLQLLTHPIFFPVYHNSDITPGYWEVFATVKTNGPFAIEEWERGEELLLTQNEHYWDQESVLLDQVSLVMLDGSTELNMWYKGELDWAGSPLSQIPADALVALQKEGLVTMGPFAGTALFRVNTEQTPFNNSKIRRALAGALNRAPIMEHVYYNAYTPATELVPPDLLPKQRKILIDGEIATAQQYFQEGLEELGITLEEFPPITLDFMNAGINNKRLVQLIQQQWQEALGVKVILRANERGHLFTRIEMGDYEVAYGSWIADFYDPINFLAVFEYKDNGVNNTGWQSDDYHNLLETADRVLDSRERIRLLALAEEYLMEAMPVLPLFHYSYIYVKNPLVRGVHISPMGIIDLKHGYLAKKETEKQSAEVN